MKIHPLYASWWGFLFGSMVLGEFVGFPAWVLPGQLIGFAIVEGIAVWRKARGDTLSEMVWAVTSADRDLRYVAWAVAIYLPLRFSMIALTGIPEWIPAGVLALGVAGFLIPHFSRTVRH